MSQAADYLFNLQWQRLFANFCFFGKKVKINTSFTLVIADHCLSVKSIHPEEIPIRCWGGAICAYILS